VSVVLRRGWWLALVAMMALGLWRIRFDTEVMNLLPAGLPVVEGLKLYQKHFASADELIVTVQSGDAEMTATAAKRLALALRTRTNLVARALWQPPWQEHPEEMAELLALTWLNQPPGVFAQLADRLSPDKIPAELAAANEALATSFSPSDIAQLGYDPLGLSRLPEPDAQAAKYGVGEELFASSDGTFRLLFLKPAAALASYRTCTAWFECVRSCVEEIRRAEKIPAAVRIAYTGAPAFVAETAGGMERDMSGSATGTMLTVAVLFWWAHRRLWPLCWLTIVLLLVMAGTLALGGLIYGALNVVSLGFAAILVGLTDDYPAILYQEALDHPHLNPVEIRRRCTPAIMWSAVTTASAFLLLNFGALPGLAQLGTLVALGVLLAAVVVLYAYLPIALKRVRRKGTEPPVSSPTVVVTAASARESRLAGKFALLLTLVLPVVALACLCFRPPRVDHSAEALSPTTSPAYVAMKEISSHLAAAGEPLWILISGRDEGEVARRMDALSLRVQTPEMRAWLGNVTFPSALWPRPEWQRTNLVTAAELCQRGDSLRTAVRNAGFTEEAFALAKSVLVTWERAGAISGAVWPTDNASRWLLEKVAARTEQGWLALGIAQPKTNTASVCSRILATLDGTLADTGVRVASWPALGEALLAYVAGRLIWLVGAMVLLVAVCLWLVFRNLREVLLSFTTLGVSFLSLLALMSLLGWSWNLMNLTAVPLLLGATVDYTIHTQLALRRTGGDIAGFRRTTARALLLGGSTTIVGFGSLSWAGNAGLASLGLVCAVGITCGLLASLVLLPVWWVWLKPQGRASQLAPASLVKSGETSPSLPSSFYRVGLWRFGFKIVRVLPAGLFRGFFVAVAEIHFRLQRRRREIVIENLLPVLAGNRSAAGKTARRLYRNFAVKLADLWRLESGVPVESWVTNPDELNVIQTACARGRGVLFVTLHLGNWEHGGLLLDALNIPLTILTLAEPDEDLTALRVESRARQGIQTILIGEDNFAVVEVIKRLQAGAALALSIDRPPKRSAVEVELFGRPFGATMAAAELARASGCALIGVTVVRTREGFAVKVLPEFAYDRQALRNRESRRQLTQEILRAFEPQIQQHLDQWYQFVPIWPNCE